jgi:hypothetical protein
LEKPSWITNSCECHFYQLHSHSGSRPAEIHKIFSVKEERRGEEKRGEERRREERG